MTSGRASATAWRTVARVGRWHVVVPLELVLMAIGFVQRSQLVTIPVIDWLVPAPLVLGMVSITVGLLPLYSSFHLLERTFVRAPEVRACAVAGSCLVILAGSSPALGIPGDASLIYVLLAVSILAVVVVGEYAWLVSLALGFTAMIADGSRDRPLTTFLNAVPLLVWVAAAVIASAIFWRFGPLEHRQS